MTTLRSGWPITVYELRQNPEYSAEPLSLQEVFGSQLPKVEFLCKVMWVLLQHGTREQQREFLKNIT